MYHGRRMLYENNNSNNEHTYAGYVVSTIDGIYYVVCTWVRDRDLQCSKFENMNEQLFIITIFCKYII